MGKEPMTREAYRKQHKAHHPMEKEKKVRDEDTERGRYKEAKKDRERNSFLNKAIAIVVVLLIVLFLLVAFV